ncbi:MAG: hypothetical protein A2600_07090 [Candidatus Lambdaproteobacteria bacterium RIFOXYD1_FULL_56_27]|uniref:DUF5723 domain-containing protein n=1 Tax=Candidatus Lambdaproteobacteria bacterium RIFOXYD2_FULL_56_26 TaxID=1817773 RepID=A0A1F6GQ53_9PROT|nr:MAG: hypothetical protein A2557_05750 [Candidatus Lambdaproteobacteria bacterium RIFOXYD2_FULL_56_26]OGH03696.1 MAG: hypothetical protein A2426_00540 [Candidatus Lambdaproteobacteria bacterium RIFOXYC1_FULL_56_13]OGH07280.1 MAG: hypothetical protein A2600_07090 [Candidatus Lambdaproteobacteria bacterium RIFOXYD1_FULL_56_27]
MKQTVCLLLLWFAGWGVALGGEYRRLGQDYRSLAMGNTGIVTANSSSALFYNPAVMANITTWWVDLPMIQLTYSKDAKALVDQAKTGSFTLSDQSSQIDFMKSFVGKHPYVGIETGANLYINLQKKGLTVGANYTYEAVLDLEIRNPTMPEIDLYSSLSHVRQYGISIPLGLGKWVIGFTGKTVERTALIANYSMADSLDKKAFPTLESNGVKGIGSGYDLGLLYRDPSPSHMMYGFVYRKPIDLGEAGIIPEEYAVALGLVQDWTFARFTAAVDWRDLTYKAGPVGDHSLNRRTHVGTELSFIPLSANSSLLHVRAGYNQGYYSKGVELSLGKVMVFGYTLHTEETGEYAGQKGSDRTTLYFSLGF